MYRIAATNPDGASYVIYDPVGSGPLPVLAPRITEELNEAGSLEFSLVYGHPAFDLLYPKQTYLTVTLDGNELFYGRLLSAEPSPLGGQIQYTVAGALSFLQDGEMAPDPKNDDGSYDFQTMTAEAFFRRCISEFNSEINNDPRRMFYVGIVNHPDKSKEREYQINSYTNFSEVIRQNIIDRYGGFLRVRPRPAGGHFIDWVSQYGEEDNAVLSIGQNILSITNRMEGEDLITAIRPVGRDGLVLSGSGTLDIFPDNIMAKYGKIVRSVQLGAAETESELSEQAHALIDAMHKSPPKTSEIGLIDLHFADSAYHGVNLGDVFNHIAGLEGERMTVSTRSRDCENPQNDSVTLKNPKQLEGSYDISDYKSNRTSGYSSGDNTLSRQTARAGGGAGMAYKYIHETQDRLELATKHISINAEELELHADMFVETANEFARLSHVTGTLESQIGVIEGTGVIQNSEFITSLAGQFQYDPTNHTVSLISGTEFRITKNGADITVGDRLTQLTDSQARFEGSALWTRRDSITGVCGEFDIVTGADGQRRLVIRSGGGIAIRRNNVEFGLYDNGNLTGGIMVDKINQNSDGKTIEGTRVNITASQVHVGSTSNVAAWMSETGSDINDLQGLVADRATIAQLDALTIKVNSIDADYIKSQLGKIDNVAVNSLSASKNIICSGEVRGATVNGATALSIGNTPFSDLLVSASVSGNTLTLNYLKGGTTTFSKAITSAAWGWSNGAPKVTLYPQRQAFTGTDPVEDVYENGNQTWASDNKSFTQPLAVKSNAGTTIITTTMRFGAGTAYTAGVSAGVTASAPSRATLGSKVAGTVWNVSIAREGGYSSVGKTINLASVYTDARSGYYTKAQYDARYNEGWNDCIDNCSSGYYLNGYTTYNGGSRTSLYTSPSYGSIATGSSQVWRYGGSAVLRYTIPSKK